MAKLAIVWPWAGPDFWTTSNTGNPIAQNRIATLLAHGRGVPRNDIEAAKWHFLAARAGRNDAWLDGFVAKLSDSQRKEAETRALNFRAIEPKLIEPRTDHTN